jgi:hypothetical protein
MAEWYSLNISRVCDCECGRRCVVVGWKCKYELVCWCLCRFAHYGKPKNTALLSTYAPVHKRVEDHGVSETGEVTEKQKI